MTPRVVALGLLLALAWSGRLAAVEGDAEAGLGEPVILSVRQGRVLLSDGLLGFAGHERGPYVPLGQLCRDLGLAIEVDVPRRSAEGFYLLEERTFLLDVGAGVVRSAGHRFLLEEDSVVAEAGDLYVRLEDLETWWQGVELHYSPQSLALEAESDPPLPAVARLARAARGRRVAAAARRSELELPAASAPYALLGRPVLDVDAELRSDHRGEGSQSLRLRAAHDLFGMGARWFLELDSEDSPRQARLALRRSDPSGGLLGTLSATAIEIGDISGLAAPLVSGAVQGKGVRLSNRPRQLGDGASIDLRGDLPAGWEAELLHNGSLVGLDAEPRRGEYFFPEVPLFAGINDFSIILHGPQGQRRETKKSIRLGGNLPAPGRWYFETSALLQDRAFFPWPSKTAAPAGSGGSLADSLVAHAHVAWGLTPGLAVAARLSALPFETGRRVFGSVEATWLLPALELAARGVVDRRGRWAGSARVITGLRGGLALFLRHQEFSASYRSPWSVRGLPSRRRSELRLRRSFRLDRLPNPLRATFRAKLTRGLDGRTAANVHLSAATTIASWRLRHEITGGRTTSPGGTSHEAVSGTFDIERRAAGRSLGAGVSYSIAPELRATGLHVAARASLLDTRLFLRPTVEHSFDGPTTVGLGVGWRLPQLELSARLSAAGDGSWSAALGLRFSVDWRRHRDFPRLDGRSLSRRSLAYAKVFLDEDRDGVFSSGDSAVAGARLTPRGWSQATDSRGLTLISLSELSPTAIALDESSLGDPYLRPETPGYRVSARPGAPLVLDFPLVRVGDLEGMVTLEEVEEGAGKTRGLGNALVVVFDQSGREIARRRSEFDGFFAIEGLPLGVHRVRIDRAQAVRHGLDDGGGVEVELHGEVPLVTGLELRLVREGTSRDRESSARRKARRCGALLGADLREAL